MLHMTWELLQITEALLQTTEDLLQLTKELQHITKELLQIIQELLQNSQKRFGRTPEPLLSGGRSTSGLAALSGCCGGAGQAHHGRQRQPEMAPRQWHR